MNRWVREFAQVAVVMVAGYLLVTVGLNLGIR